MTGMEREREREKDGETSWREDKESRHGGVKLMQMMTHSVLQQVNEDENKYFFIFFFKEETALGLL